MKFTFSKEEMYTIINSLDFYSRIYIGQYDRILSDIRWYKSCRQLDDITYETTIPLKEIRHILLPELDKYGWNGSHGIFSDEIDYRAGVAYDMQQEFRYKLAYFEHPEGGISVDFTRPMQVKKDPYPFPYAECFQEGDEIFETIKIYAKQRDIIIDALKIQKAKLTCEIKELFSYYTKNKSVLKLADQLTQILSEIDDSSIPDITIINEILRKLEKKEKDFQ